MPKFSRSDVAGSVADNGKVRVGAMASPKLDDNGMSHPTTPTRRITPKALLQAQRILDHVRDDLRGEQAAAAILDAYEQGREYAPLADLLIVEECAVSHGLED